MGSAPNCDGNSNGEMGIMITGDGCSHCGGNGKQKRLNQFSVGVAVQTSL